MLSRVIHRDTLRRVIRLNDYVVWASNRQGYGMQIGRVTGFAKKQIWITLVGTAEKRRLFPTNCIVITAQMEANTEDGVGSEADDPVSGFRELMTNRHSIMGQTAESWFAARGIDVNE